MRVIATKTGFYKGARRRVGKAFDMEDNLVEKCGWVVPEKKYVADKGLDSDPEPTTFTEMNRARGGKAPVKAERSKKDEDGVI